VAWSREQLANAALIVGVGRSMGLSTRDIQIGLITAMVESNLVNVNYGDRDSLGLFQQRPSQGWGTPEQVTDPYYSSKKFFTTLTGLGDNRFGMGMGEAAQAVQRSAYPERYAERIGAMRSMWPEVQGAAGEAPQTLEGDQYLESLERAQIGTQAPGEALQVETPEPLTPTAKQMLGAWGMSNPTVQQPEPIQQLGSGPVPMADPYFGAGPLISPATNASVIQPISEETGDYTKGVDGWRKAVISAAKTALGVPYTWGGNSLQGGVDCSGLLQQAFAAAGIEIPRVSYQQANSGTRIAMSALRPGDLVAWDNSSRNNGADHIALYIGGGQVIEAARPGTVVRIRSIEGDEGAYGVQIKR